MTQEEAIARLSRYQTNEPSKWRKKEEEHRRAKEEGWPRLLKGEENFSLETICKLENALNVPILQYEFA